MAKQNFSELQQAIIWGTCLLAVVLVGWLFLATPSATPQTTAITSTPISDTAFNVEKLLDSHNIARNQNSASNLVLDEKLAQSASLKCNDMASKHYWAHDNPAGGYSWTVWFSQADTHYTHMAENLYRGGSRMQTMSEITQAWLNSAGHKANIVDPKNKAVGFAECYDGLRRLIVAHFGG